MSINTSELKDELKKTINILQTIARLMTSIEKHKPSTASIHNIIQIEKAINKITSNIASLPDTQIKDTIDEWVLESLNRLQANKAESMRAFGTQLERALQDRYLELRGHYPRLKTGIYTIELDFNKAKASIWYGPKEGLLARSVLSVPELVSELDKVRASLTSGPLQETQFLDRLQESYRTVLTTEQTMMGEYVPVVKVLEEFLPFEHGTSSSSEHKRAYLKAYNRAYFSHTIFKLRNNVSLSKVISLLPATRAKTANRADYIWVPSDDKGNGDRCAYILVKEMG